MGLLLCCVSFEPASDSHNSGKTILRGSIFREGFQKALFTPSKLIYAGKWKKEVSFIQKRVRPSQGRHASVSRQAGKGGKMEAREARRHDLREGHAGTVHTRRVNLWLTTCSCCCCWDISLFAARQAGTDHNVIKRESVR